jgi:putative chitinase
VKIDRVKLFKHIKQPLFNGKFTQSQVDGLNFILDSCETWKTPLSIPFICYMLATAYHETGRTMQPIEEYGKGRYRRYGKKFKISGQPYIDTDNIFYGRGYVQLTWYDNYKLMGRELGLDLIHNPRMALNPVIAAKIMIVGMTKGWFTGKKLTDYFNTRVDNPVEARRIINGVDRAEDIAKYYHIFKEAIL